MRDAELAEKIIGLHRLRRSVYGALRIHALLAREGERVSQKRVARIMAEHGLRGVSKRAKPKQKKQKPECGDVDDLARRDFSASKPNESGSRI
ncbi:IS3 family transposase [Xiamenia xianingshaonis]|uniref:IS3 family transposase n=1 Tax=Xiamenia xianingshaonis TaxID=2682776 RepID=UPI0036F2E35B